MPDFHAGKIYCIHSPSNPDAGVYVGSTTWPLSSRFAVHRYKWRILQGGSGKNYGWCSVNNLLEYPDCCIKLLEEYPCESNKELIRRERDTITRLRAEGTVVVNQRTPGTTNAERCRIYYQTHKEELKERARAKYLKNREEILQKSREAYWRKKEMKELQESVKSQIHILLTPLE